MLTVAALASRHSVLEARLVFCTGQPWRAVSARGAASDADPQSSAKGAGKGRSKGKGGGSAKLTEEKVRTQVRDRITSLRASTRHAVLEDANAENLPDAESAMGTNKFRLDWRDDAGHNVPYRFRLKDPPPRVPKAKGEGKGEAEEPAEAQGKGKGKGKGKGQVIRAPLPYSDYAGLRFPTLETAENTDYNKHRGLDRIQQHVFPLEVPGHRRIDPYLREYIHFLHSLDPVRFSVERISERYRLRGQTVRKVIQEWGVNSYLLKSGLVRRLHDKQSTREKEVLKRKESEYARWAGWDQLGDAEDVESDDEMLGDTKGWRSTNDWVRRQNVEVEMMSAFPMSEKRDPMPKRVDVDLVVERTRGFKVINWIDPADKVVF